MIVFDTSEASGGDVGRVDATRVGALSEEMTVAGLEYFDIEWEGFGPIVAAVEDDVRFICDSYRELPEVVASGREDLIFWGDGVIEMTARRVGPLVSISCRYMPFLHRGLVQRRTYSVSVEAYVKAWDRLMHQLIGLVPRWTN